MATLAQERSAYALLFGDCIGCEQEEYQKTSVQDELAACEEAIHLYEYFLQDAIYQQKYGLSDQKSAIALLKRELQEAKSEKRRILAG